MPALEAFFLSLRARVDPELRARQPVKLGKPYPVGQCLEITQAVEQLLHRGVDELELDGGADAGRSAYSAFRRAGGSLRQVWGDLRGAFFQNAFQLGGLYVDVSNDTVVPTKPQVEVLPFAKARLTPVRDFHHFARLAERYWQGRMYPNHLLPELAPFFPLIYESPSGLMQLQGSSNYMLGVAVRGHFLPSASVLGSRVMPADVFRRAHSALAGLGWAMAEDPVEGRQAALRACAHARKQGWHASRRLLHAAGATMVRANQWLAGRSNSSTVFPTPPIQLSSSQEPAPMSTITINNCDYDISQLSPEARQQLDMLLACDQRLRELQRDMAITQTARNAYANALQGLLPSPLEQAMSASDTVKLQ